MRKQQKLETLKARLWFHEKMENEGMAASLKMRIEKLEHEIHNDELIKSDHQQFFLKH